MFNFYTYNFGRTFETLLNHKCEKCVDHRRDFRNDISVMSKLFAPAVGHLIVECVLRLSGVVWHLSLQVNVVLGADYVWTVSVAICMPSKRSA
jgi:hypothetical protein